MPTTFKQVQLMINESLFFHKSVAWFISECRMEAPHIQPNNARARDAFSKRFSAVRRRNTMLLLSM